MSQRLPSGKAVIVGRNIQDNAAISLGGRLNFVFPMNKILSFPNWLGAKVWSFLACRIIRYPLCVLVSISFLLDLLYYLDYTFLYHFLLAYNHATAQYHPSWLWSLLPHLTFASILRISVDLSICLTFWHFRKPNAADQQRAFDALLREHNQLFEEWRKLRVQTNSNGQPEHTAHRSA
jgi:hypothetical protein